MHSQCDSCQEIPESPQSLFRTQGTPGHKKAVIAIARMLLTAIYNMLRINESYNAELYRQSDQPPTHREVSVAEAIFILQRQGYLVTVPPVT